MPGWSTALPDWEARIRDGRSLVPDLPLFENEADKAVRVFNRLRIPDVTGRPAMRDAAGDWFRAIVRALFGSYDAETDRRMIQEVFLLVPKKNSKSTNAAGVMLTATIVNRRPEAEALFIAPTKEIADIAFRQASGMIRADPELDKLYHQQRHIRTITHRLSGAMLQIKAADTDAITGVKATYILIDETHEFAAKSRAADVFIELRGALAARPDGFLFQISTQSKTPPAGVFKAELQRARDVRDGRRDLPLLPVIYELPGDMAEAWRDPAHFALVNPNLGRSVSPEFLAREMDSAVEVGTDALVKFASQHLNVEIGLALKADAWPGAEFWEGCATEGLTLDQVINRSEVIVAGVDGGGLDDLLGLAVVGRDRETREWLAWHHAWAHPSALKRRKSEAPKYRDFADDGDLTIVEAMGDDVDDVAEILATIDATGKLDRIGVDQAGIGAIIDALDEKGISEDRIVAIPQGWRLNGAIKTAERKLAEGTLRHGGQPLMAWCVGNAKVEMRGSAVSITKQAAGTGKIDPLMALFDAVTLMALNPAARGAMQAAWI